MICEKRIEEDEGDLAMLRHFTLEYWIDDGWYVGRLKEVPGVFSQGETMDELEENIRDAYQTMTASIWPILLRCRIYRLLATHPRKH